MARHHAIYLPNYPVWNMASSLYRGGHCIPERLRDLFSLPFRKRQSLNSNPSFSDSTAHVLIFPVPHNGFLILEKHFFCFMVPQFVVKVIQSLKSIHNMRLFVQRTWDPQSFGEYKHGGGYPLN